MSQLHSPLKGLVSRLPRASGLFQECDWTNAPNFFTNSCVLLVKRVHIGAKTMQSLAWTAPIQTRRLYLRVFELTDLDALAKANSDPEIMRHTGDGNTVSREEIGRAHV